MRVTHSAIKSLMVLSHAVIAAALTLLVNPSSAQGPGDPWSRIVQPFFRDMEIGELNVEELRFRAVRRVV
jgi:hypothetical protein